MHIIDDLMRVGRNNQENRLIAVNSVYGDHSEKTGHYQRGLKELVAFEKEQGLSYGQDRYRLVCLVDLERQLAREESPCPRERRVHSQLKRAVKEMGQVPEVYLDRVRRIMWIQEMYCLRFSSAIDKIVYEVTLRRGRPDSHTQAIVKTGQVDYLEEVLALVPEISVKSGLLQEKEGYQQERQQLFAFMGEHLVEFRDERQMMGYYALQHYVGTLSAEEVVLLDTLRELITMYEHKSRINQLDAQQKSSLFLMLGRLAIWEEKGGVYDN